MFDYITAIVDETCDGGIVVFLKNSVIFNFVYFVFSTFSHLKFEFVTF